LCSEHKPKVFKSPDSQNYGYEHRCTICRNYCNSTGFGIAWVSE
jgi:hypothetical protein